MWIEVFCTPVDCATASMNAFWEAVILTKSSALTFSSSWFMETSMVVVAVGLGVGTFGL
jgi:hypothetical protein